MTDAFPGMAPPASLALPGPVVGFDPSTLRMSAGGLLRGADRPEVKWDTLSLPRRDTLHVRQHEARVKMVAWIDALRVSWGEPVAVGIEQPFSGGHHTEPASFYIIGVLLECVGAVWPDAELMMVVPGWWKVRATGAGSVKGVRGKAEKERILAWARECAGYTGDLYDESDAIGIATGVAVELERRDPWTRVSS